MRVWKNRDFFSSFRGQHRSVTTQPHKGTPGSWGCQITLRTIARMPRRTTSGRPGHAAIICAKSRPSASRNAELRRQFEYVKRHGVFARLIGVCRFQHKMIHTERTLRVVDRNCAVKRRQRLVPRELLREEEACRLLRISREAILRFKRDQVNPIPHLKVGRRFLYEEHEVIGWAKRSAKRDSQGRRDSGRIVRPK